MTGGDMEHQRSLTRSIGRAALIAVGLSLIQLQQVVPAAANHISGAIYDGTHAGGGTITFSVTPNGSGISSVSASNIPGDFCTFESISTEYTTPLPITDHAFADSSPPLTFSGSFPAAQSAQGTLRATSSGSPSCDTGDVSWTATTTAAPPPGTTDDDCKAAKEKVAKAKAKLKKADGDQAKERARKKLKRAKAKQRAACG